MYIIGRRAHKFVAFFSSQSNQSFSWDPIDQWGSLILTDHIQWALLSIPQCRNAIYLLTFHFFVVIDIIHLSFDISILITPWFLPCTILPAPPHLSSKSRVSSLPPSFSCLVNEIKTTVRSLQIESDKLLLVTKLGLSWEWEAWSSKVAMCALPCSGLVIGYLLLFRCSDWLKMVLWSGLVSSRSISHNNII